MFLARADSRNFPMLARAVTSLEGCRIIVGSFLTSSFIVEYTHAAAKDLDVYISGPLKQTLVVSPTIVGREVVNNTLTYNDS